MLVILTIFFVSLRCTCSSKLSIENVIIISSKKALQMVKTYLTTASVPLLMIVLIGVKDVWSVTQEEDALVEKEAPLMEEGPIGMKSVIVAFFVRLDAMKEVSLW